MGFSPRSFTTLEFYCLLCKENKLEWITGEYKEWMNTAKQTKQWAQVDRENTS